MMEKEEFMDRLGNALHEIFNADVILYEHDDGFVSVDLYNMPEYRSRELKFKNKADNYDTRLLPYLINDIIELFYLA